jgi:Rieske Fe-S protein
MEPSDDLHGGHDEPHLPHPTLWPVGFAVGIAVVLVGLIVSPTIIAPIGGVIMIVFGFLWARDATAELRGKPIVVEPERGAPAEAGLGDAAPIPANVGEAAMPGPEPGERFPRSRFLEGATLGVGAVIGGLVTLPVAGFAVLPAFVGQKRHIVDLGPLDNFPLNRFVVTTFLLDPHEGETSRRTSFIRNNGSLQNKPSFTIISNRCAHLGCPVQPNGPLFSPKNISTRNGPVKMIETQPAGFGCPCHGGQYDTEGNRTAGPPVRALDRYDYAIVNGRLSLLSVYSVSHVDGTGANAKIHKYKPVGPGEHVDGPEQYFYPINPVQH